MTEAIIVAIITGLFAILGQYMVAKSQNKQRAVEEAKREQQILDRIDRLEEKVMLHNNVVERTYALEKEVAVLEEKVD